MPKIASKLEPTFVGPALDADKLAETATAKVMSNTERDKLTGIAQGATANSSDSALLNRTNHTGTQPISSIEGLEDALSGITGQLVVGVPVKLPAIARLEVGGAGVISLTVTRRGGVTVVLDPITVTQLEAFYPFGPDDLQVVATAITGTAFGEVV